MARSGICAGASSPMPHIMEIFCPPRFSAKSRAYGIYPSFAFDLTIGWDLNDDRVVRLMWKMIKSMQPIMIFGSPNCGPFSQLANLNKHKPKFHALLAEGMRHLSIVSEVYRYQLRKRRYFCHEHPALASSWETTMMKAVSKYANVISAYISLL